MDKIFETIGNPEWRIRNLYSIINKGGQRVPFRLNSIQTLIRKSSAKRKMILKARQFGVSTESIIDIFDDTCFNMNRTSAIIAHEDDSIKKLFRIVMRAYKFMPEQIRPVLERGGGSKYEYYFPEINSRIYCDLESRSDTVQNLHVSEAAFMKDSSRLKSTLQAVPMGGRVSIETTPNGIANFFYEDWIEKESTYEKLFFPWYIFPDYRMPLLKKIEKTEEELLLVKKAKRLFGVDITDEQIAFRRFKKAELKTSAFDKKRVTFEQEYPEDDITCFLSSGESVFDLIKVKKLIDQLGDPIREENGVRTYKEFDKTKRYVCGADPAEGIGRDFSVGVMLSIDPLEVVGIVRGQWKPSDFTKKLIELCEVFARPPEAMPILAVERNNHGHAVILALNEIHNYPNLYVHPQDERLGWKTDSVTRPIMINAFIDAVEDGLLKVNDRDILAECLTLIDNLGKIEAAEGKHDDCVAATAISLQVALQNSLSAYENIEERILL